MTKPIDYKGLTDSLRLLEARDAEEAFAATTGLNIAALQAFGHLTRWRDATTPPPLVISDDPGQELRSELVLCSCSRVDRHGHPPHCWYEIARYYPAGCSGNDEPEWLRADGIDITSWVKAWQFPEDHPPL